MDVEIVERTPEKVVLSRPFTWEEAVTELLWWMVDTREMRLYWGYVGDTVFLREPQPEEGEILELLGFPPFSPAE